jgi:hypothetical protein
MMKQAAIIRSIDLVAFVLFLFLLSSGVLMRWILPPGSGRWSDVWGLSRHQWGDIHFALALLFVTTLSAHLILHRQFIRKSLQGSQPNHWRTLIGLVGLLALLGFAAAPLVSGLL